MTNGNDAAFSRQGFALDADSYDLGASGLTKREYFAALAFQGMLATERSEYGYKGPNAARNYAEDAVEAADALIEALNLEEAIKAVKGEKQ